MTEIIMAGDISFAWAVFLSLRVHGVEHREKAPETLSESVDSEREGDGSLCCI